MCLEFSKVENEIFKSLYNSYSKLSQKLEKLLPVMKNLTII